MSTQVMKTSKHFQGYYSNSTAVSGGVYFSLRPRIAISSGITYSLINPKVDVIFKQTTPLTKNYTLGISFSNSKLVRHKLGIGFRSNTDRSPILKFDYTEQRANYTLDYKSQKKRFNLKWRNAFSVTTNKLVAQQFQKRFSLASNLAFQARFSNAFQLGTQIDYTKNNRYTEQPVEYLFYGVNLSYNKTKKVLFNFSYRNNYPLEEFYKTNSFFNLNARYRFNKQHIFTLSGRLSNPSGQVTARDLFLTARYDMAINLPLAKNKNLGNVRGVLQATDSAAQDNVLVHLDGFTTLTDASGHFEFNDLSPGTHFLSIEQAQRYAHFITAVPLPVELQVEAQQTTPITLELLPAIRLTGAVTVQQTKTASGVPVIMGLPPLVLKLEQGNTVLYTKTNKKGKFEFHQLRPGPWTLTLVTKGSAQQFSFPQTTRQLQLEAGKEYHTEFEARPKVRKINFSKKKFILEVKKQ